MRRSGFMLILMFVLAACTMPGSRIFDPQNARTVVILQVDPDFRSYNTSDLRVTAIQLQQRVQAMGPVGNAHLHGDNCFVMSLYSTEPIPDSVIDTLISTGLLEMVDMSMVDATSAQEMIGQPVLTAGGRLRGVTVPEDAFSIDDDPFPTILIGGDIVSAQPQLNDWGLGWKVYAEFSAQGSERMAAFTGAHIGDVLGVVLDGTLISAPVIQAQISNEAVISGGFTEEEAFLLAARLTSGPLQLPLEIVDMGESLEALDDSVCFAVG